MIFVEHTRFPIYQWAADINAELVAECITVTGVRVHFDECLQPTRDLLWAYRKAPKDWTPKKWHEGKKQRTGKNSPHIQFANADTDGKLMSFVRQFGPVVTRVVREEDQRLGEQERSVLTAEQDMAEFRNERLLYHSALTLVAELRRGKTADIDTIKECISQIAEKVADWPRQWQRERRLRLLSGDTPIPWEFTEETSEYVRRLKLETLQNPEQFGDQLSALLSSYDPIGIGHRVICELVNAFKPQLCFWGRGWIEGPHIELRYGIRPLLYHILRRQCVEHGSIAVCANVRCRELYELERAGQRFCSELCSQQQRQREYWAERGKRLRKKRQKHSETRRTAS